MDCRRYLNCIGVCSYDNFLLFKLRGEEEEVADETVVGVDDRDGGSRQGFWNLNRSTKLVLLPVLALGGGEKVEWFVCDLD